MLKTILALFTACALLASGCIYAGTNSDQEKIQADLLAKISKKYPNTKVTSIRRAEMGNLYEVVVGNNIAYVDPDVKYFMFGHIFDMEAQHDLTQDRVTVLNKVTFSKLPLDKAIKIVKGDGKRVFALFTDPECPYCKRFQHDSMPDLNNYTMYVFLYPIAQLHPSATDKANAIWCAKDRVKAYNDALTGNFEFNKSKNCSSPIKDIQSLALSLQVQGTPTLIRDDGDRLPGMASTEQMNTWLNKTTVADSETDQ